MFFRRKKLKEQAQEKEIQAVRSQYLEAAEKSVQETEKLIQLLDSDTLGITELVFLATGGDKRSKGKTK